MQLSQEIFNILKGANIKLKLFDPMGNKTLDPELSARFYAYDNDFLVTIREEEDGVELVVQAGASFNFNEHKDLLNSIKKAGHNAMAEYNIRKFDKNIELKDFAHDVVKEDEEIRRLKELSGIRKEPIEEGTEGCADCEWIKDETDGDIDTCDDCAAEKRQTNESEKRWKQTSMSPEEAIEKYGKENVKVKKGALRNGDDMVEVFVESYSPGDEYADSEGMVSDCCGAPMMDYNDGFGRCGDCKEMASGETEEEFYEATEKKAFLRRMQPGQPEVVGEGYSPATGSMKTSYIQLPENTKLIIKHTKGVNEEVRGSRSRNIRALFIENSAGERFRFPHKYLQGAKAMANHVSKGGTPYDAIGESITKLCTEVAQCSQFLRHVRTNKLTNEGNENIVETVKQKLKEFKNTVKSLQTSRGYNNYQVPTTAIVEEKDKESVDLTDKFMYNTFETANMDAVLETVARIVKEKDGMTDLTKTNINRLYDMIKNKEDFKLNIDPNDPEHPDNEDPIKYSGGNGAMAKLVSHLSYLAMNSKNDEVFNLLSQISGEMYSLPKEHVILLAKIAKYLDKNNKAPAKEPAMEDLAEATLNSLRRKIA